MYYQHRQAMAAMATTRWALTVDVEKMQQRQRPLVPLQVEGLPPATLPLQVTVHFSSEKAKSQFQRL